MAGIGFTAVGVAMKTCPKCHSQIPLAATRCSNCSADFSAADMAAGDKAFKARRLRMLIAVGLAIAVFYVWTINGGLEAFLAR